MPGLISADELLKTKSVPELRKLVSILNEDANSKKVELQHLVGSKYHDFIESADSITQMLEYACIVQEKIPDLWGKKIHGLITSSKELLDSIPQNTVEAPLGLVGRLEIDVVAADEVSLDVNNCSSSSVWKFLEKKDLYNAAKTVMFAELLVGEELTRFPADGLSKNTLFAHIKGACGGSGGSGAFSTVGVDVLTIQNTLFLTDVVLDEVMMALLCADVGGGEWSVAEKCKLLSVLSVLKRCESEVDVCQIYLNFVTLKVRNIEHQMKTLIQRMRDDQKSGDSSVGASSAVVQLLKDAIACLQTAIVDMYQIFISPAGSLHSSQLSLCTNQFVEGLIGDYLKATVGDSSGANASSLSRSFLNSIRKPALNQAIHSLFVRQWLLTDTIPGLSHLCHDWIMLVTQELSSSLGQEHTSAMTPSANMTAVKNELHMCCMSPAFDLCSPSSDSGSDGPEAIWKEACAYWFAASSSSVSVQQSYLWNSVFRGNFLLQMSELLSSTIMRVVTTFNDTYIARHVMTKSCSIAVAAEGDSSVKSSVRGVIPLDPGGTRYGRSAGLFSAVKIFKIASHCFQFLYKELQSLMLLYSYYARTTAHAFETNAAEAEVERVTITKAFSEHLFVLFALILCILRNFSVSAVKHKQHLASKNSADAKASLDALTNAQLIIGRIVWLINDELCKTPQNPQNVSFLLGVNSDCGGAENSASNGSSNLVTENQIYSAFEIIDTDGAGCLQLGDINEVLQVLVIEGDDGAEHDGVSHSISRILRAVMSLNNNGGAPSMSLACSELVCVCGCYLTDMSVAPVTLLRKHLQMGLTEIFTKHTYFDTVSGWIEASVATGAAVSHSSVVTEGSADWSARVSSAFAVQLAREYLGEATKLPGPSEGRGNRAGPTHQTLRCQLSWLNLLGDGVASAGDAEQERLPCPTAISSPLYLLLSRLAGAYGKVFLSYDVLINTRAGSVPTAADGEVGPLCEGVVLAFLRKELLSALLAGYDQLLVAFKAEQARTATGSAAVSQMFESIATQVLFDLMVVRLLYIDGESGSAPEEQEVTARVEAWEEHVDSITYSLLEHECMGPHTRSYYNSVSLALCPILHASASAELSAAPVGSGEGAASAAPLGGHQDVLVGIFNKSSSSLGMFPMLSVPIATTSSSSSGAGGAGTSNGHSSTNSKARISSLSGNRNDSSSGSVSSGSSMLTKAIGSFW